MPTTLALAGNPNCGKTTPLSTLAFMVFTLIYTPCLGAVGMILKETRSVLWTGFTVVHGLGWLLAWFTILGDRALGFA